MYAIFYLITLGFTTSYCFCKFKLYNTYLMVRNLSCAVRYLPAVGDYKTYGRAPCFVTITPDLTYREVQSTYQKPVRAVASLTVGKHPLENERRDHPEYDWEMYDAYMDGAPEYTPPKPPHDEEMWLAYEEAFAPPTTE